MIDKTLQDAYQNLLKENTRLHAEKKQIVEAAEKAIRNADEVITKLEKVIDSVIGDCVELVRTLPDSSERLQVEQDICNLTPLKVSASGQEKVKK